MITAGLNAPENANKTFLKQLFVICDQGFAAKKVCLLLQFYLKTMKNGSEREQTVNLNPVCDRIRAFFHVLQSTLKENH